MNLRLFQRRRWKTALRAGYSSNIASQLLAQAVASLAGAGAVGPGTTVLLPFSHGISNLDISAVTNVDIGARIRSLSAASSGTRCSVRTRTGPSIRTTSPAPPGLNLHEAIQVGNISGQYGRELGYGSITGQSGTIEGQTYRAGVQHSTANGMVLEGTVHGSDQTVHNAKPLSDKSCVGGSRRVHARVPAISARAWAAAGRGVRSSAPATNFATNGYTARASIEHPRFQVGATHQQQSERFAAVSQSRGLSLGRDSLLLTAGADRAQ